MATSAPAEAITSAISRPIRRAPPVTRTDLPFSDIAEDCNSRAPRGRDVPELLPSERPRTPSWSSADAFLGHLGISAVEPLLHSRHERRARSHCLLAKGMSLVHDRQRDALKA